MGTKAKTRDEWITSVLARIVEVGQCEEWTGAMMGAVPVVHTPAGYLIEGSRHSRQSARSVVWMIKTGQRPPNGTVIRLACGNDRCLKHDHMRVVRRGEHVTYAAAAGRLANSQKRQASAIAARRKRATKITIEQAREVRLSSETSKEAGIRLGVSAQTIQAIRRGDLWREAANGSSVFSWRPAA